MARIAWKLNDVAAFARGNRGRGPARRGSRSWRREFDLLEQRALLATDVWTGAVSSSWSEGSNWSLDAAPGATDIASFTNSGNGASLFSVKLDSATAISGLSIDGSWHGRLTIETALALSGTSQVSGGTLDFSQGTGSGGTTAGSLVNSGNFTFGGSAGLQWDAADEISNSGTLAVSNGANFTVAGGGTLANSGTINDDASGSGFQIDQGSSLDNRTGATFDFLADGTIGATGTPGSFSSSGLIEKSSGTGVSSIAVDFSNTGGRIEVNSGTLSIAATGGSSSGGVFSVGPGATLDLTGGQTVTYAGGYSGSGAGAIVLASGTLAAGSGGVSFNFSGPVFQWKGGTIDTTLGKLTNTGTMNLTGAAGDSVHLVGAGPLNNFGQIDQSGGATLDLDAPVTLNDESTGVYNFATDASISEDASGGTFLNAGIVEKTGGSGKSSIDAGINFRNTGTVSVGSGTLAIGNSGAIITAGSLAGGTWVVAAGSDLSLPGNITTLGATVELEGQGASFAALDQLATISASGVLSLTNGASIAVPGNLDNAGTLELGPGTLNVAGNFTQESSGVFKNSVGGTTAGTGFGQLTVHSKATLAGSLEATVATGFTPVLGESLPIIPFGSSSGAFGVVSGLALSGPLSLAAEYGTSSVALQTVKSSSATLSPSVNPAVGVPTTFTVKVQAVPPQTGTPTGTVTFLDGTTRLGTATLSGGQATFSPSTPLALGLHAISASYGGDASFGTSTSNTVDQEVEDATSTTVMASVNPSVYSQALSFTATVSSTVSGAGTPTGSVTFMDGTKPLGTANLTGGTAVFAVPTDLATATHSITAVYGGDTDFATSTSPAMTQTVNQDGSITTLKSTLNPSSFGGSVTLEATASSDAKGHATPTGSVTFKNGSTSLGTVSLTNGRASLAISTLAGGSDSITAVYSGDTNFTGGTSPAVSQTVNPQGTQTSLTSAGVPSVFGQDVTFNVAVKPDVAGCPAPDRHGHP